MIIFLKINKENSVIYLLSDLICRPVVPPRSDMSGPDGLDNISLMSGDRVIKVVGGITLNLVEDYPTPRLSPVQRGPV